MTENSLMGFFREGQSGNLAEAKECFLEKMESMDLTMLTCLHTPPRFVLKRLEDPRIKNLEIDADLLEAPGGT